MDSRERESQRPLERTQRRSPLKHQSTPRTTFTLPRDHVDKDTRAPGTPEGGLHLRSRDEVEQQRGPAILKPNRKYDRQSRSRSPVRRVQQRSRTPPLLKQSKKADHYDRQTQETQRATQRDQQRPKGNLPWWIQKRMEKRQQKKR